MHPVPKRFLNSRRGALLRHGAPMQDALRNPLPSVLLRASSVCQRAPLAYGTSGDSAHATGPDPPADETPQRVQASSPILLPNGRPRIDYIRDRYYRDHASRSTILAELNQMLAEAGIRVCSDRWCSRPRGTRPIRATTHRGGRGARGTDDD